jgi:hypothetical protein
MDTDEGGCRTRWRHIDARISRISGRRHVDRANCPRDSSAASPFGGCHSHNPRPLCCAPRSSGDAEASTAVVLPVSGTRRSLRVSRDAWRRHDGRDRRSGSRYVARCSPATCPIRTSNGRRDPPSPTIPFLMGITVAGRPTEGYRVFGVGHTGPRTTLLMRKHGSAAT